MELFKIKVMSQLWLILIYGKNVHVTTEKGKTRITNMIVEEDIYGSTTFLATHKMFFMSLVRHLSSVMATAILFCTYNQQTNRDPKPVA